MNKPINSQNSADKTSFDDIRPYDDSEVPKILSSLVQDKEFLNFLAKQTSPKLARLLPRFLAKRLARGLTKNFQSVDSVAGLQQQLAPLIAQLIEHTCSKVSITGLDKLDPTQAYVFMSNHKDIIMDPLLVNHGLLSHGFNSCRLAIGDNLLKKDFIAKLMRLNKSFVVNRSVKGNRKKLASLNALSEYIHVCIKQGQSIWLAQQSGRSKDGLDNTDTAVLKMLYLAGRKLGWDLSGSLKSLNIVPVAISYEWDPCDVDKAKQLLSAKKQGEYEKAADEDLKSMLKGLKKFKGQVSVHFSDPISLESQNVNDWALAIDDKIHGHYEIYPSNQLAHDVIYKTSLSAGIDQDYKITFKKRFRKLSPELNNQVLLTYSQPVMLKDKALSDS